ncbi:MAG: hypothetical protein FD180_4793 [Planctomycetota bacterium]|nr:MAG: hypothetical protein FD180_4793 [Planctomycetota bacterium]
MHDHFHDHDCQQGPHPVWNELSAHLPFSVGAVIVALSSLAVVRLVFKVGDHQEMEHFFHISHAIHVLLAATGTTAMFLIYGGKRLPALAIGVLGSAPICTLADILFPWMGGKLLGQPMEFHVCAIEEPFLIFPCVALGVVTGVFAAAHVRRLTIYSHSGHVLVSAFASSLYLMSFGVANWMANFGWVLLIVTVAVVVPCCASDIILPLLFAKRRRRVHPEVGEAEDVLERRH